ncbi:procathepsin L-like [Clupea harengus]|uniref:Procathepsin L-like n=1 Tax=Clupea harengus TaxID=7950 RepID=A0A6P8ER81_CLUHA|nr:procathepsin L-like [Clupea harengus]
MPLGWCGSCWAFSTVGSVEGQHFKKTGQLISLSEQNLVDCSTIQTYDQGNHLCRLYEGPALRMGVERRIDGGAMPSIAQKGIHAAANYRYIARAIYEEPSCSTIYLNHAEVLVGYGFERGVHYWIIKNSWGTAWGENGYMRMRRDGRNTCGIASYAMYPLM